MFGIEVDRVGPCVMVVFVQRYIRVTSGLLNQCASYCGEKFSLSLLNFQQFKWPLSLSTECEASNVAISQLQPGQGIYHKVVYTAA